MQVKQGTYATTKITKAIRDLKPEVEYLLFEDISPKKMASIDVTLSKLRRTENLNLQREKQGNQIKVWKLN